ncbi:DUF429 domain-containing protein [Nonomuraea sp. NPDC048882]|uniref:DUF429 domain-containing protein n=1 Tax=Nonomuraea sp. NPDC048882 TaxID=3154347 RepID=UPI0033DA71A0
MLTAGIDLAAEPPRTAVAWLTWSSNGAQVTRLELGAKDDLLIEAITAATKTGIDCPFGWPVKFIDFITAHRTGHVTVPQDVPALIWRHDLTHRVTDQAVEARTGRRPLSASADRIGHTTMRCAALLSTLAAQGHPVDRRGTGAAVEVYPAATLRLWNLPHQSYKRPTELNVLVDRLKREAPWLDLAGHEALCRTSADATDAVICALAARAGALGLATTPPPEHSETAAAEGWIALPTTPLNDLIQAP